MIKSLKNVRFKVRIFTEIPGLITVILDDVHDPLVQKMLYVLYNMTERFLTYKNKKLFHWAIFWVAKEEIDWIEFQCVINCLIVLAT